MKTQSKQQENKHETKTDTMTMKDLEKQVDYYSEKASTYCHQLGMAVFFCLQFEFHICAL